MKKVDRLSEQFKQKQCISSQSMKVKLRIKYDSSANKTKTEPNSNNTLFRRVQVHDILVRVY